MTMRTATVLLLALLSAGCGLFSRSKSRFYELERIAPASPVVATGALPAAVAAVPVGIDGVELPPGFDRRELVVRSADRQLDVRGTDQWSAALGPLVLHTLAADLAGRLPDGLVILPGAAKPLGPMRSIDVVFEELVAGPGNTLVLDARWTLRQNGYPEIARHEQLTIPLESLDGASIAAGTSRALATLADRMAAEVASRR